MVFLWFSHGHPMASHGLQMLDAIVQEGVRAVVHRRLHLLRLQEPIQLLGFSVGKMDGKMDGTWETTERERGLYNIYILYIININILYI